jgi:NAD(P)-dependent dehydrogenase (short-subunit alcohol dehydrogenase family)
MKLTGKVAIVTGAGGGGCGRAISRCIAEHGAAVVVSDIDQNGASETVRRIEESGGRASLFPANVRHRDEVQALIAHAEHTFGGLDILISNASAPYRPDEPLDHWMETIETDLLGTMYGARLAIDAMRRRGGGAIVNIGSTSALPHGRKKGAVSPAYDTAKAAVMRFTTMLGPLAAKENIRVNCLAPDWVATDHIVRAVAGFTPEQRKEWDVPQRITTLEEIAAMVLRLATDESLNGRIALWVKDVGPRFIPCADPGFAALESF